MANNNSFSFLCYQAKSKKILSREEGQHLNVIVNYRRSIVPIQVTTTGGIGFIRKTYIDYGCSKDGTGQICAECDRARRVAIIDRGLIISTLGVWWIIGYVVTRNAKPKLNGITRYAAERHSEEENGRAAAFHIDSNNVEMYEYEGSDLKVY